MEELQDAIEDAQYVNAISTQEDGPRPLLAWDIPTEERLEEWKSSKPSDFFELERLTESAIGMFLFSSFLKDTVQDYLRINFIEDVVRWRQLGGHQRVDKAKRIITAFLKQARRDNNTGQPIYPEATQISETNLERRSTLSFQECQPFMKENFDSSNTKCCIGLDGPVRDQIFATIHQVEQARAAYKREKERLKQAMKQKDKANSQATEDTATTTNTSTPPHDSHEILEDEPEGNGESQVDDGRVTNGGEEGQNGQEGDGPTTVITASSPSDPTPSNKAMHSADWNQHSSRAFSLPGRKSSTVSTPMQQQFGPRYLRDDFFDQAEAIVFFGLKEQYSEAFAESEQYKKLLRFLWYQDRKVIEKDFFTMRVLGRGGFGLVEACKKGASGKLYAMKTMDKKRIKMKKSEQLALNERAALAAVESPFVVNLKYSFQSTNKIYLVLDLMTGGDLGYHLHKHGRFPRRQCIYYAARIMLGLQALHDKQYVYRDLKPENCLLADDGRVKITDLGLATKITPTLHGAAGTRGYWAPEMLRRDARGRRMPYGYSVDWFSFGCCLAEFICGQNPFRSDIALNFGRERGKSSKEKAIDCATLEMNPEFDDEHFDADAADLCRKLLEKNENIRLGCSSSGKTGCEEIMRHPWFKDVHWDSIISDKERPPYIPPNDVNAASQSEIGNFPEDKTYQETVIDEKDEEHYKSWDWTNPRAYATEVIEFLIYERVTGEPLVPQPPHSTCCCVIS